MLDVYLKKPSHDDKREVFEFKKEFEDYGSFLNGAGGLSKAKSYSDWINKINILEKGNMGDVPRLQYLVIRKNDNKIIGMLNIRKYLDDYYMLTGGHIGLCVRPTERRKGYATKIIQLAILECDKLGIKNVLITCDKNNIASAKAIVNNNGKLENEVELEDGTVTQRYWIEK